MTETDAETPAEPAPPLRRWDWHSKLRWFASEYLIVVLGVLTAVGINAAWQARQDRAQEQVYLRQLAEDLRQTERRMSEADSLSRPPLWAAGQALRAYRTAERPPRDSLLWWWGSTFNYEPAAPVLGTAEALIATGDLSLVRNDSLRGAIPAYLERMESSIESSLAMVQGVIDTFGSMTHHVDLIEAAEAMPQALIDSLARSDHTFPIPEGPRRRPFPVDPYDLLEDQEVYATLSLAQTFQLNLAENRAEIRQEARALRTLVESQIDP